jgi:hypothetical protein
MNKQDVILLARDLLKIRISSAREGPAEDDGVHNKKVRAIPFYGDLVMVQWYKEVLKTAELIIALEDEYLNNDSYQHADSPP